MKISLSKQPIFIAWIITSMSALISVGYYFFAQPQIPIFYSLATKSDQLAQKEFVFLFPIILILMNFTHLLIVKVLKNSSSLVLNLFVFTTNILQIIFLLSLIRIVIITI